MIFSMFCVLGGIMRFLAIGFLGCRLRVLFWFDPFDHNLCIGRCLQNNYVRDIQYDFHIWIDQKIDWDTLNIRIPFDCDDL